jgi:hypothetical protein
MKILKIEYAESKSEVIYARCRQDINILYIVVAELQRRLNISVRFGHVQYSGSWTIMYTSIGEGKYKCYDLNAKRSIQEIRKTVNCAKAGIIINCHKHRDESRHNFI